MTRPLAMGLSVLGLVSVGGPALAGDRPALPKPTTISYATLDKKTIAATYWGSATAPAVVLLADEGEARASIEPAVAAMLARRLAAVALEVRAATPVDDVVAAVRGLRGSAKGRDGRKVGILGIGVRGATALEAASRLPDDVSALLCLAPKASDAAAEALKALRPDLPVLVTARTADAADAKRLHTAIGAARAGGAPAIVRILEAPPVLEGDPPIVVPPGAGALGVMPLFDSYVAGYFARELGSIPGEVLLDGDLSVEGAESGAWTKAAALPTTEKGGQAWGYRVDRRVVFGGWMPPGITYLHVKLRGSAPGLDWTTITASPIAPVKILHEFSDCLFEAPVSKLRVALHGTEGVGGPMPPMKPGVPPELPPRSADIETPFRVVFAARAGGWSFEGEYTLKLAKVKSPRIEMAWGWRDQMPGLPKTISFRPWMNLDLEGPWTEVPAR